MNKKYNVQNNIENSDLDLELRNSNMELGVEGISDIFEDESHKIAKGNKNQDIRFNSNKNRQEINRVTSENQLR